MINQDIADELRNRTKKFAVDVACYYRDLPLKEKIEAIDKQLLRSATSEAANYRSSCRARSKAEFLAKPGIAVEEADEFLFWLKMAKDPKFNNEKRTQFSLKEGEKIMKILSSSHRTSKQNHNLK